MSDAANCILLPHSVPRTVCPPSVKYHNVETLLPQTEHQEGLFNPDDMMASFVGVGRGEHYSTIEQGVELYTLAERFAYRVAGHHNKNVIFILFGPLGSGKSMALLSLADACSHWLAHLKGGAPEDYFTMEDNVAVIDPEMLREKLNNLKKYNVYILDDAGPGYDARSFMSNINKELGHIFQTCRTQNNIIMVSAPHGAMLDVNIHRLAQFYGEIVEVQHSQGQSFMKVFKISQAFRNRTRPYYAYLTVGNATIKRFQVLMPPQELVDKYDKIRIAQALNLQKSREEREAEKTNMNQPGKRELLWEERIENDGQKLLEAIEKNPDISPYALSKLTQHNSQTTLRLMFRLGWAYDVPNKCWVMSRK